jgi:LysM repeat protein
MRWTVVAIFCALQFSGFASSSVIDSVGVEQSGDNIYIKHVVTENETLYSLSRRYDVPIYKIIESNPPTEFGLEVGQIIRIPYVKKEVVIKKEVVKKEAVIVEPVEPQTDPENKTHIVEAKQTLFSISRMYNVTVSDIKLWNNLSSNELEIGQQLEIKSKETSVTSQPIVPQPQVFTSEGDKTHVVIQSETLYSISRQYSVGVDDIKKWNNLLSNEISIGQQLIVGKELSTTKVNVTPVIAQPQITNKKPVIDTAKYNIKPETRTNFEEIIESGLAEQIEGSQSTRKYLAMHRKAKTGTIMKIRNEMNDQEVFVRIIGKLPDTGVNKNVVIKISKAAYDRLGAIDPKFRVTISYIP